MQTHISGHRGSKTNMGKQFRMSEAEKIREHSGSAVQGRSGQSVHAEFVRAPVLPAQRRRAGPGLGRTLNVSGLFSHPDRWKGSFLATTVAVKIR